jgi:hypothetical protein
MPSTYQLITANTLTTPTASVTLSAIPSTFTDLVLKGSIRCDESSFSNEQIRIRFNSLSTSIYSNVFARGDGSGSASALSSSETSGFVGLMNTDATTSNTFSNFEIYIPSYLSSVSKQTDTYTAMENNATTAYITALANLTATSAAITSLTFTTSNARNFVSGSSFFLYGIKNS